MISMDIQEGRISEIYVITYWGEMETKETNKRKIKGKENKKRKDWYYKQAFYQKAKLYLSKSRGVHD